MPYIYNADTYCDSCGPKLLKACTGSDEGDPQYYPYVGESDSPDHCGSGADCEDAIYLADYAVTVEDFNVLSRMNSRIGAFLDSPLTDEGYTWLEESFNEPGKCAHAKAVEAFWQRVYDL